MKTHVLARLSVAVLSIGVWLDAPRHGMSVIRIYGDRPLPPDRPCDKASAKECVREFATRWLHKSTLYGGQRTLPLGTWHDRRIHFCDTVAPSFMALFLSLRVARSPGSSASTTRARMLTGKVIRDAKGTVPDHHGRERSGSDGAVPHYGRTSSCHAEAVIFGVEAAVVHWNDSSTNLPTVQEAHRRMVANGRLSKVRYASLAHEVKRIDQPAVKGERQFKTLRTPY